METADDYYCCSDRYGDCSHSINEKTTILDIFFFPSLLKSTATIQFQTRIYCVDRGWLTNHDEWLKVRNP